MKRPWLWMLLLTCWFGCSQPVDEPPPVVLSEDVGEDLADVPDLGGEEDLGCQTSEEQALVVCQAPGDACVATRVYGDASSCSWTCVDEPRARCFSGDGCCPKGCTRPTDMDCEVEEGGFGAVCNAHQMCAGFGRQAGFCQGLDAPYGPTRGWCTSQCGQDADCPESTWCTDFGICVNDCTQDSDCRPEDGFICYSFQGSRAYCTNSSWDRQGSDLGGPCQEDVDCKGANNAFPGACLSQERFGWPGGTCVWAGRCQGDGDCSGRPCIGNACAAPCTSDASCRPGYTCQDYFERGHRLCAPDLAQTPNVVPIGAPCMLDDTCQSGRNPGVCLEPVRGSGALRCSTSCFTTLDCPTGTVCLESLNQCAPACEQDGDCPASEACQPAGESLSGCVPRPTGVAELGGPCEGASDCKEGPLAVCLPGPRWPQGSCSVALCRQDSDCPSGSHCGYLDGTGYCLDSCSTQDECAREGYRCRDVDGDGATECASGGTGEQPVGASCRDARDCAAADCLWEERRSERNFYGGYCSECCTPGTCPAGSHCAAPNVPEVPSVDRCMADCVSHADCRYGYECVDRDGDQRMECSPSGVGPRALGETCTGSWECGGGVDALCIRDELGNVCSKACGFDGACGPNGACIDFPMRSTGLCQARCQTNADCKTGWFCGRRPADNAQVCLYSYGAQLK